MKHIIYKIVPAGPGQWDLLSNSMAATNGDNRPIPENMRPVLEGHTGRFIGTFLDAIVKSNFEAPGGRIYQVIWQLPSNYYDCAE